MVRKLSIAALASFSIFFTACSTSKNTPSLTGDGSCAFSTGSRINSRGISGRGASGCTTLPPVSSPFGSGTGTGTGTGTGSGEDPTGGGGLGDPGEGGLGGSGSGSGSGSGAGGLGNLDPNLFLPGNILAALAKGLIDPAIFKGQAGADLLAKLSEGIGVPIPAANWEPLIAVGQLSGGSAVTIYEIRNDQQIPLAIINPFDGFQGGANVALGDVDGDNFTDVIIGAGETGGPRVSVFRGGPGAFADRLLNFYAYDERFRGGVNVASADIDGDDYADIITGAGPGGGPHIQVISGRTHQVIATFFAFDENLRGGVFVAAGDVDGDGYADIIAGAGKDMGAKVRVFKMRNAGNNFFLPQTIRDFVAYPGFTGAVHVGATDYNGDYDGERGFHCDIITGAGPGGGPHVAVWNGQTGAPLASYFAYDQGFRGGVNVSGGYLINNNDDHNYGDIVTGAGPGGGPHVALWAGQQGNPRPVFGFFDGAANDNGGRSVAAALGY